ncbi:MAG: PQQ-dependent sugar dehydrogenase [Cytophagaceae bacterium]|nr:PQQ-dependent sugar dehydrogenase [Cytophagaceae bacterium]
MQRFTLVFLLMALAGNVFSQTYPTGFSQQQLATGIASPTAMTFAPDGRLFICQQNGTIKIVKNGAMLVTNFGSIPVNTSGERGLLGLAFDPNFSTNQFIYIYYTLPDGSRNRLSRITATGDVMVGGSESVLVNFDALSSATNHNGGFIKFGADGKLYVAIGENANSAHAQNLDTHHGKLLRLNTDGTAPSDNPFYSGATTAQKRAVWALGLRNPFSFDVQPGTGKIFVNDVGQNTYEEINNSTTGGQNFGWPSQEGTTVAGFSSPVYFYSHGGGDNHGCAITGGVFFSPGSTNYPGQYAGNYFYMDYCNNWINRLDNANIRQPFATSIPGNSLGMATGPDGNLYFLSRSNGSLNRIIYTPPASAPVINTQPASQTVQVGQAVTFSVMASGTAPLSYQWYKNNGTIATATGASYTINPVAAGDAGTFKVVVTNPGGSTTSNGATLTVTSVNGPPTAQITTPAAGATYAGGNAISFSGTGSDPEDGADLPASAFAWRVDFHHDVHTHPGPSVTVAADGRSGTFAIPTEGETAVNVFYRVYLTVRDANNNATTTFRDIQPRTTQITLATDPAGLSVTLDGTPVTTPYTFSRVEGILLSLGAVSPQTGSDGQTYTFSSWQHGGAASQTLATPVNDITYRAVYSSGLRNPDNPANPVSGLNYRYYEGEWNNLPNFDNLTSVKTGNVSTFSLSPRNSSDRFGFVYTGFVSVPADGTYDFFTNSDDGSRLYIGATLVVNNDGLHGAVERSGRIGLKQGLHAIRVDFFEKTGSQVLTVSYDGPTFSKRTIRSSALFRTTAGATNVAATNTTLGGHEVLIYPNPASTAINVAVGDAFANATVKIYDLTGRLVKEITLNETEGEIDIDELPNGIYLVTVQKNGRVSVHRVVVAH